MRPSIGHCFADYGFSFLEKVHEPIFLINRSGILIKINEAGRKFLRVTHLSQKEMQAFFTNTIVNLFKEIGGGQGAYRRIPIGKKGHLIARSFNESDLLMIELVK
jgi:hypothetical protein